MSHKYEMTVNLHVITHLGLNLYSNTSAVISEAVVMLGMPIRHKWKSLSIMI